MRTWVSVFTWVTASVVMAGLGSGVAIAEVAEPPGLGNDVHDNRVVECPPPPAGATFLTTSSNVLYVNDCRPNGCQVTASNTNSSITNESTIADTNTTMSAWSHGDAAWETLVQCVRDTFAPFNIQVVTESPAGNHFEVMVGGTSGQLSSDIEDAGGIAPFISCGAANDNLLAFVFAGQTDSLTYLCNAVVHEAGHIYGLSHSLDSRDPMTYIALSQPKQWTNADQMCGTDPDQRQQCRCFQSTNLQNSFRALVQAFGLSPDLADASLQIMNPRDGAYVVPGFPIVAEYTSELTLLDGHMSIDNGTRQPAASGLFAWNAPTTLAPGNHTITVQATDYGDRTVMQTIDVNVLQSCAAGETCGDGLNCLENVCLPGRNVEGGLGATCNENRDCITRSCASDGSSKYCTADCAPGGVCPSGFSCLSEVNQCWPDGDGGGCSAGGGSASWLAGLGAVLALRRRRPVA